MESRIIQSNPNEYTVPEVRSPDFFLGVEGNKEQMGRKKECTLPVACFVLVLFCLFGWLVVLVVVGWLLLFLLLFLDSISQTMFWIKQQKPWNMFNVCFFLVNSTFNQPRQSRRSIQKPLHQNEQCGEKNHPKITYPPKKSTPLKALKLTTRLNQLSFFFPWRLIVSPVEWPDRLNFQVLKGTELKGGSTDLWRRRSVGGFPKTPFSHA